MAKSTGIINALLKIATKLETVTQFGANGKGVYAGGTQYQKGDLVTYNGLAYIAITATIGNLPTNTTYWQQITIAGPAGTMGPAGAQGVDGAPGADGADGTNSLAWSSGTGVPTGGVDGDYYLRTTNGDVYKNTAGTWSVVTNITGPAGSGGLISGNEGFGDNYQLNVSFASNGITLALKDINGADPSGGSPVTIRIANTKQTITSALSKTVAQGTANIMQLGSLEWTGKEAYLFAYLIQETGASAGTKIGFSRIGFARKMSDFVNTNTDKKYIAGSHTNFNATDDVQVIGRFKAKLTFSTPNYNWAAPTTQEYVNKPIDDTNWMDFTPQPGASGSMTYSTTSLQLAKCKFVGNICFLQIRHVGTTAGTASSYIYNSLPFAQAEDAKYTSQYFQNGMGNWAGALLFIEAGQAKISKSDSSNLLLATDTRFIATCFYQI